MERLEVPTGPNGAARAEGLSSGAIAVRAHLGLQVEYRDAVVADSVPKASDARVLDPGESSLLQVWYSRPLPSPKPLSLTIERFQVFACPRAMAKCIRIDCVIQLC